MREQNQPQHQNQQQYFMHNSNQPFQYQQRYNYLVQNQIPHNTVPAVSYQQDYQEDFEMPSSMETVIINNDTRRSSTPPASILSQEYVTSTRKVSSKHIVPESVQTTHPFNALYTQTSAPSSFLFISESLQDLLSEGLRREREVQSQLQQSEGHIPTFDFMYDNSYYMDPNLHINNNSNVNDLSIPLIPTDTITSDNDMSSQEHSYLYPVHVQVQQQLPLQQQQQYMEDISPTPVTFDFIPQQQQQQQTIIFPFHLNIGNEASQISLPHSENHMTTRSARIHTSSETSSSSHTVLESSSSSSSDPGRTRSSSFNHGRNSADPSSSSSTTTSASPSRPRSRRRRNDQRQSVGGENRRGVRRKTPYDNCMTKFEYRI